ncbi:MAG: hypothetical protein LBH43_07145 [Treponema sp.]|jgi:hypothetical protein|nr:hypothetical protein [Treponema sp.]
MNKTYFCVMSETYRDGAVKSAITTRNCKAIPQNATRVLPIMIARMRWFESLESAEANLPVPKTGRAFTVMACSVAESQKAAV